MNKVIFLHGFNSCGQCSKSDLLQQYLPEFEFITPDLPNCPSKSINYIKSIVNYNHISRDQNIYFIGCNLGSFYSMYFAEKYAYKAFLIEPVTNPYELLLSARGRHFNWTCSEGKQANITKNELDYIDFLEHKLKRRTLDSNIEVGLNEEDIYFDIAYEFFKNKKAQLYYYNDPKNTTELIEKLSPEIKKHFS